MELYPKLTAEGSSEGGITPFQEDSEESSSSSKSTKASGKPPSTSKEWSEFIAFVSKRKALKNRTSVFINGMAQPRRKISRSITAPGRARFMSGSFEYSNSGENPNIQISTQGEITVTVGYEQLVGDKVSRNVLVIKEWKEINKDGIERPEHGFESVSQGHTSTVFEVDAVIIRENAGTDRVGENFMTKVGGTGCQEWNITNLASSSLP